MEPLRIRHVGRVSYLEAYDFQRALLASGEDYLLMVEHPRTITMGRRAEAAHVLVDPASIEATLIETDRGGDVTLHGPGQVVAYPIITIDDHPGAARAHVGLLEDAAIATVAALFDGNVPGGIGRLDGHPGVWVGIDGGRPAKVAAVGVRTEVVDGARRTMHGIALNVDIDLSLFDAIVPCGIPEHPVTSLAALGLTATVGEVGLLLARTLASTLLPGRPIETASTEIVIPVGDRALSLEPMARRRLRAAGVDPDAGLPLATRKPSWLRVPVNLGAEYSTTHGVVSDLGLVTVCEEAGCPNIFECWADGTATFMINGERCTRACGFCLIDTRKPEALDPTEPERVAEAVERMGLAHAVVTCVARDDLPDGGAGAIADTIRAIKRRRPDTAVEVLISDCKGDLASLELIFDAQPDVLNHNIETVARLQRAVRPSAGYVRSLTVLARAFERGLVAKSGLMLGLGETDDEVRATLADLHAVGVSLVTIGQYLRPTKDHLPVARYAEPAVFDELAAAGRALGLAHVQSSPLTRSSYHARDAAETATNAVPVTLVPTPAR